MARKQDTRTVKSSGTKKPAKGDAKPSADKAPAKGKAAKAGVQRAEKAKAKAPKVQLSNVQVPNVRKPASPAVRTPVSHATSVPASAKKALKSARAQAKALIPTSPQPPAQVSANVRAVGDQIAAWLDSDLGRVMAAELLVYLAEKLTRGRDRADVPTSAGAAVAGKGDADPVPDTKPAKSSKKRKKGSGKEPSER